MAAENGAEPQHLTFLAGLAEQVDRHGVFSLLRAVEARAPNLPRIGNSRLPSQNIVDLAQTPTLSFPPSTLDNVTIKAGRARVEGYWLGLTGPMGPLPLHLSEFAYYERRYSKRHPFGQFLDMLSGRMLQLFYRAWAESNPASQADRPDDDRFAYYLSCLTGATEGAGANAAFPARARLHYAGLFASHRTAVGIEDALSDLLRTHVRVEQYQPRWRKIEGSDQTRLGGEFAQLGVNAVMGGQVRGVTDAFRVVVRAKNLREFEELLPTGRRFAVAAEALDAFAPSHLEWDIEIELDEAEIRPTRLDGRGRLGWTGWMAPKGSAGTRADTRLGRSARKLAPKPRGRVST